MDVTSIDSFYQAFREINPYELYTWFTIHNEHWPYPLFIEHLLHDWGAGRWGNEEEIVDGIAHYQNLGEIPKQFKKVVRIHSSKGVAHERTKRLTREG